MRFSDQVVAFDFAGIPMVGNMNTGYAIGLTAEGAAVCERLLREEVAEPEVAAVDAALLEHLVRGGFFSDEKPADAVVSAYLHVTQRCNLSCVGCYSFDDQRNCLPDAPLEAIERALDELAAAGLATLIISGGEPFLRDDLPDIVAYAKRTCGIKSVTVLSNGTCLAEGSLAALAPNVDCVSISFDGCSASAPAYIREEQRFDELVAAVKAVQAAGIQAHIIPTVHKRNIDDLADYVRLSKDLGATLNFSLLTCAPDDELAALLPDEEALRKLGASILTLDGGKPLALMDAPVGLNLTVKRNCGAGYRGVSIAADGTVSSVPYAPPPRAGDGQRLRRHACGGAGERGFRTVPRPGCRRLRGLRHVPLRANLRGRLPSPLAVRIGQSGVARLLLRDDPRVLRPFRSGHESRNRKQERRCVICCFTVRPIRVPLVLMLDGEEYALRLGFKGRYSLTKTR